ncbi:hypothetical protein [Nonomuraea sp. NPDC002799]
MISDDIWLRIDPGAGMTAKFGYGRWLLAGLAAVLVAVAWFAGTPHLSWESAGTDEYGIHRDEIGRPETVTAHVTQTYVNDGWLPVTVTGAGSQPRDAYTTGGLRPDGDGGFPRTIPAGGSMKMVFDAVVTDCAAAVSETMPVVFEVETWWGRTIADPEIDEDAQVEWFISTMARTC